MGAPIKPIKPIKTSESQPSSNQNERGQRLVYVRREKWKKWKGFVSFYTGIILATYLILSYLILPNHYKLPMLDSRIFEVLIQVIATILGFAIVAIFYYLGKFEDLKSRFSDSLITTNTTFEGEISQKEKDATRLEKEKLQSLRSNIHNSLQRIMSNGLKVFEGESKRVRKEIIVILISFGLAILVCFVGLFFTTEPFKQLWDTTIWASLIGGVSGTISTSYLFNDIWVSLQGTSNQLFNLTLTAKQIAVPDL
jgi:hypothetical protein